MRGMHHIPVDRTAGATSTRPPSTRCAPARSSGLPRGDDQPVLRAQGLQVRSRAHGDARVPIIPVVIWGSQRVWTKARSGWGAPTSPSRSRWGSRSRSRALTPTGSPPTTRPSWSTCSACSAQRTSHSPGGPQVPARGHGRHRTYLGRATRLDDAEFAERQRKADARRQRAPAPRRLTHLRASAAMAADPARPTARPPSPIVPGGMASGDPRSIR